MDWLNLVVSYSWSSQVETAQELTSWRGSLILPQRILGEGEVSPEDATRVLCEVITIICLHILVTFLPGYMYHYSLSGNNKFVLCHGLEPI